MSYPFFYEFFLQTNTILGVDEKVFTVILIPLILGLYELVKFLINKISEIKKSGSSIASNTTEINFNNPEIPSTNEYNLSDEDEEKRKTIDITLKSFLHKIRKKLDADRVFVAKFHNGNKINEIYPGDIFQVYTIISESLSEGIGSEKNYFINIPTGFFKSILDEILKNDKVFINDLSKIENSDLQYVFKYQGIQSFGAISIKNETGQMIGVLGIEFIKKNKDVSENDLKFLASNSHYFVEYINKFKLKK